MDHTEPARAPAPLTVVVDGQSAAPEALARGLKRVVATAPRTARLLVCTPHALRLPAGLARRVRVVAGGPDQLEATVTEEVARDQAVVVLPARTSLTSPDWWPAAQERFARSPRTTGVIGLTGDRLFAFPPAVTTVDGPQALWSALPGADLPDREVAPALVHQSLSAVLIVKDEEDVLEACLSAVAPFVDEIVVYDTGSTDRTLEIARAHADLVIEGHWDDDFSAARNRALAHATTDWVLSLDADEVAEGDVEALRRLVDHEQADAVVVPIVSTTWRDATSGDESRSSRLFRRVGAEWRGALHEQVTVDGGRRGLQLSGEEPLLRLVHSGYTSATIAEKDKRGRNLAIARAALAAAPTGSVERANLLADYGRSLALAGEHEECLEVLGQVLNGPAWPGNVLQAGRVAVPLLLARGRWAAVDVWLTAMEEHGESRGRLTVWRAGVLVGHERISDAAELLDDLLERGDGGCDLWGKPFDPALAGAMQAELDLLRGLSQRAASRMLEQLAQAPETVNLQVLVNSLGSVGGTMRDLILAAPPVFLERSLRHMTALPPAVALPWFAAHCAAHPDDYRPLVAGCTVAARTGVADAAEWSVRAREAGLTDLCPLRDLAEHEGRSPLERCLAWALLGDGFAEDDAVGSLEALFDGLGAEEAHTCLDLLGEHVPVAREHLIAREAKLVTTV